MFSRRLARRRDTRRGGPARLVVAALTVAAFGCLCACLGAARPAVGAQPTMSPFVPGRHVYDYANLLSADEKARAEAFAGDIEAAGGGRTVVYTDTFMDLPNADTLASAWGIDGLLITGNEDMGEARLGDTLKGRLSTEAAEYFDNADSTFEPVGGWTPIELARADGLLRGRHVFDGTGTLDAASLDEAEAAAVDLGTKIGGTVYVDIAESKDGPASTAFFNGAHMSSAFDRSLVIALAVAGTKIGGYIDSDSDFWDSYQTSAPWSYDTMSDREAAGGDVRAALLAAIHAVNRTPNPVEAGAEAASWIADAVRTFFSDPTNVAFSLAGFLAALLALVVYRLDRRRRRREGGFADDESVLLPAPPDDMTPALASMVASPLDMSRAVTVALLDLAAHGFVAFRQGTGVLGGGTLHVISAGSSRGKTAVGVARPVGPAASRPLGPAEEDLLAGLRAQAGVAGDDLAFADLRPLFENTVEQLERTARARGWLNLQSRAASNPWTAVGLVLLAGAAGLAYMRQPLAALSVGLAGLVILPGSRLMPLPLRTASGVMTTAMAEAYRRTLRLALADAARLPPWVANAEEAALWGYAWGLEGEVARFVAGSVGESMAAPVTAGDRRATLVTILSRLEGSGARPVGLDTDAVEQAVGNLGSVLAARSGRR